MNIAREHIEVGREHVEQVLRRSMSERSWLLWYYPDRADHDMILYQAAASVWPPSYGGDWRSLVDAVDEKVIPGAHGSAVVDPNVTGMSNVLSAVLGEYAERRAAAAGAGVGTDD